MTDEANSWTEYRRLVLSEIERLFTAQQQTALRLKQLEQDMAVAKAKAGIYGGLAGLLLGGAASIVAALIK